MTAIYRHALLKQAAEMRRPGMSSIWDSVKDAAAYSTGRFVNNIRIPIGKVVDKSIGALEAVGRGVKKNVIDPIAWPGRKALEGAVSAGFAPFEMWAYKHRPEVRYNLDMTAPNRRKIR